MILPCIKAGRALMLDAAILILIGIWIGHLGNPARYIGSASVNPNASRYSIVFNFSTLGAIVRLQRHYDLPSKYAVIEIALKLLDAHSCAEQVLLYQDGEWQSMEIGPRGVKE